jgi:uroporphyrinogen-III decarboxylase
MNSKERVLAAINHKQPDKVPIDIGSAYTSGISVSALYRLRDYFGLPKKDMEIYEVMQMLGTVDEDIRRLLGGDVVGLNNTKDFVGVPLHGEKQRFFMPDGTPTLISIKSQYDVGKDGKIWMYPQGNRSVAPSSMMPSGGYFFDALDRAPEFDEDDLDPEEDFKNFFSIYSDEDAVFFEREAKKLNEESGCAVLGLFGKGSIGDPSSYPGPGELAPKGIRSFEDWCIAQVLYPDYVKAVHEMQTQNLIKNLEIYKQAVGDNIQMIVISGTDFGNQNSLSMSVDLFRDLYKPYFKRMNDWVHQNTNWKCFYHSCGAVADLLDDFVDMGVDILNPVQFTAKGMNSKMIKEKYGDKLVFWGGGVDTQDILPNGTPEQIKSQVKQQLEIFAPGGGYIFNTVHNIMGDVRPENIVAAFEAAREFNY